FELGYDPVVPAFERASAHRVERSQCHPCSQSVDMDVCQAGAELIGLRRVDPAKANQRVGYVPSGEVVAVASCTCLSSAPSTCDTCWLTIGCSTRWPMDATGPSRCTSASHFMFVPSPASARWN